MKESTRVACQAVHYEDQRSSFNKVDYDSARDPRAAEKLLGSVLTRYDLLGTCIHGRLQYAY